MSLGPMQNRETWRPSSRKEGALVFIGHAACQIERAEVIVVSTAIHPDNPELVEAHKRGVPVIHRSDVLAYLMNKHKGIAVAGVPWEKQRQVLC
mgnify:CR=1 FL=1